MPQKYTVFNGPLKNHWGTLFCILHVRPHSMHMQFTCRRLQTSKMPPTRNSNYRAQGWFPKPPANPSVFGLQTHKSESGLGASWSGASLYNSTQPDKRVLLVNKPWLRLPPACIMAHFKSEGEVHDHNYIPTSALLLSRGHFGTHFEGRADHTH